MNLYRGLISGHLHASMFADLAFLLVATAFFYWLALIRHAQAADPVKRRLAHGGPKPSLQQGMPYDPWTFSG